MSILSKILPFLFEETTVLPLAEIARLPLAEKQRLIQDKSAPAALLAGMVGDEDADVRILLARRLGSLLPKLSVADDAQSSALVLEAIRQLTEDSVTPVRIALSSALKDIAKTPPAIARKLADDAERAVSEPIIRYSLSLSDDDLLALIAQYPQGWQTETIASRPRLTAGVGDAVVQTGNQSAARALLANPTARISTDSLNDLARDPAFRDALEQRNSLKNRLKRDIDTLMQHSLYQFLRRDAQLDKDMTRDVLDKVRQRVTSQETLANTAPGNLTEEQLKDAILLGETTIALRGMAARAGTDEATIRRMVVDSGAAKPVIALCAKAGLSMPFAVLCQQRLTRLPPDKIFYPLTGDKIPISLEEIKWQWDFFGI